MPKFQNDQDAVIGKSPLDVPIAITRFPDAKAIKKKVMTQSMRDMAAHIQETKAADKSGLPLFKLAAFGNKRTDKNCLRNNANVKWVSGVEADYDGGNLSIDDAEMRMADAEIAALLYSTPSSTPERPRWRIMVPLSNDLDPERRGEFVEVINALFDGEIDQQASFTLSQSFYAGNIRGKPAIDVRLVDGEFIDKLNLPRLRKGGSVRHHIHVGRDDSGSAQLMRLAGRIKHDGGTFEEFTATIQSVPDAADHVARQRNPERAISRAWKRSKAGVSAEDFDDLPPQEIDGFLRSVADLDGVPVPPRKWLVEGLIPAGVVTSLYGDGGTGKSLLAMQLAVATATESKWINLSVQDAGPVVFLSAEDDDNELHRRFLDVAASSFCELADLDQLHYRSLVGESAVLAKHNKITSEMQTTKLFKTLENAIDAKRPTLLILDTLADLFSGDRNDEGHARQFIGHLRSLCERYDLTILLLAHPSLTGLTSGSGMGGSMAWNNSVRSRMYLSKPKGMDGDINQNLRLLEGMKTNYACAGKQIWIEWRNEAFSALTDADHIEAIAEAEKAFLDCMVEAAKRDENVGVKHARNYAPNVFSEYPAGRSIGKARLKYAMNSLLEKNQLRLEWTGSSSRRRQYLRVASN